MHSRRTSQWRPAFIRGITALSITAFVLPAAFSTWVLADPCIKAADPQICCNFLGLHPCSGGGQSWNCNDTSNGPLSEPAVTTDTHGAQNSIAGPSNACVRQPRKCGAAFNQCLDNGGPIITSCAGFVPDNTTCGGGGGGDR